MRRRSRGTRVSSGWPTSSFAACLALLILAAGCDHGSPGIEATPTTEVAVATVQLTNFSLPLHVAKTRGPGARPLVLFATGDGGWRSVDQEIAQTIVRLGYPLAGFSAKDYLDHLDNLPQAATPEHVGMDYSKVMAEARQALRLLATTPVILSGFSRGAALSVIAAGDAPLQSCIQGVVVMGLGDAEEHVHMPNARPPTVVDVEVVKPYQVLKALGALPLSIIQSSRDRYLNGSDARQLFGPDTERRTLHIVRAQSHTFGGARDLLVREFTRSLAWIATARAVHASGIRDGDPACGLAPRQ